MNIATCVQVFGCNMMLLGVGIIPHVFCSEHEYVWLSVVPTRSKIRTGYGPNMATFDGRVLVSGRGCLLTESLSQMPHPSAAERMSPMKGVQDIVQQNASKSPILAANWHSFVPLRIERQKGLVLKKLYP